MLQTRDYIIFGIVSLSLFATGARALSDGLEGPFIGRLRMAGRKDRGLGPAQRKHRIRMLAFGAVGFILGGVCLGFLLFDSLFRAVWSR